LGEILDGEVRDGSLNKYGDGEGDGEGVIWKREGRRDEEWRKDGDRRDESRKGIETGVWVKILANWESRKNSTR
jgi:hypothetical protein